jgi:hypothetical protein
MAARLPRFHSAEIQFGRPLEPRADRREPAVIVWVEKAVGPDGQDYTAAVLDAITRALVKVPGRPGGGPR